MVHFASLQKNVLVAQLRSPALTLRQPMHMLVSYGLALSLLLLSNHALADDAVLQRQIEAQQRTMNNQVNQINVLQKDIAELRGELEQLRYLLSRQQGVNTNYQSAPVQQYSAQVDSAQVTPPPPPPAQNQTVSSYSSSSTSIQTVKEAGPVTPLGNDNLQANRIPTTTTTTTTTYMQSAPAQTKGPSLKGVDAAAQQAYNAAYSCVQRNDLKGAQTAFKSYVDTYPDNALTPNAWYWLGQVQYSQAQYNDARLSFLNVARYEGSQKRPDALYKLGMISKFLGDTNKAERYFQLVLQTYPQNAAATLASRELQRLKG